MKNTLFSRLFIFVLIVAFGVFANAQNDSNAKKLLDQVSANYKNKSSFYLKFNTVLENKTANTKDAYEGEVYVAKQKFHLSVPKLDVRQIYDGKKLYTIAKEDLEVTISTPKPGDDNMITPTKVFEMYKSGFDVSFDKKQKVNGKMLTFVKLTPQKNDGKLKHVLIGVDESTKDFVQMIEVTQNNTQTTVTISKQLNDIIIARDILRFNKKAYKSKGYYITEI